MQAGHATIQKDRVGTLGSNLLHPLTGIFCDRIILSMYTNMRFKERTIIVKIGDEGNTNYILHSILLQLANNEC